MAADRGMPKPGDLFHVPAGDTADIRSVAMVLSHARYRGEDVGWLVKTHRGDHFVLTLDEALAEQGIRYAGRLIIPDRL